MLMPLYVQSILGKSATISGLVVLPGSLVSAFLSPIAGRIYDKVGIRIITIIGGSSLVLSNIGMFFIHITHRNLDGGLPEYFTLCRHGLFIDAICYLGQ